MNAIQLARIAAAAEAINAALGRLEGTLTAEIDRRQRAAPAPALTIDEWLTSKGKTQGWLAEQIGVGQPSVSRWVKGSTPPSFKAVRRIYDLSGGVVGVAGWPDPDRSDNLESSRGGNTNKGGPENGTDPHSH